MGISPEVKKGVKAICQEHKDEPSPLMVVLEEIQKQYGYIPFEVQEVVSQEMGIPVAEIYGVVTFYNFFSLEPKGKYVIHVCLGTACYVKGNQAVLDKFEQILGIKSGETTDDGVFTIDPIRCMGACALAPAVNINGKVYAQMSPDKVAAIIREWEDKAVKEAQ
jgi:NADH:ubiquinone oxidoreductase subunit E